MKRIISLLVAVFMLSSLFAGCGQKDAPEAAAVSTQEAKTSGEEKKDDAKKLEGKIVFATNRTDKAENTITDLAKEFMKLNPEVTVEIEGLSDIDQVLKTRMASNELPDVTPMLESIPSKDFSLYFAPVDDLGFTTDNLYFFDKGLGTDGKLYGLNCGVSYDGIIYNKKAFAQAEIAQVPRTTDEFYAACEKLKAKGIVPMATVFKDAWPLNWYGTDYVFAAANTGNPGYRNDMKNKDEILADDGGPLAAFKLLRDMKQKGYLEKDLMSANWDGTKRDHAQGKIGMIFLGAWYPPQLFDNGAKSEDIGMFPFPGTKAVTQSGNWLHGISKSTEYPETAKAFLKWLWEESRYAKATGMISPLKDVKVDDPQVAELLSFNMPLASAIPQDSVTTEIFNKSEINLTSVLQEYVLSNNPDEVVKKTNAKWAKTRKEVMGK